MGGPSAAIVVEELLALGARRLLRVGTCGALAGGLALGDLVVAEAALAEDGASRALGASGTVAPDPGLLDALRAAAGPRAAAGLVVSADLFYDPDPDRAQRWRSAGALAVEMEAAALFAVARRHGAAAACVLAVSDVELDGERRRIGDEALARAEAELGRVGAAALARADEGGPRAGQDEPA
jgi:uridine phosphorylase